jgi:hypothetical protein
VKEVPDKGGCCESGVPPIQRGDEGLLYTMNSIAITVDGGDIEDGAQVR